MTDDEINRALAERLEPLGSFDHRTPDGWKLWVSPKRLWSCDSVDSSLVPLRFHTDPRAAVELAEASEESLGKDGFILVARMNKRWQVRLVPERIEDETIGSSATFCMAIRDAVAAALGIKEEA